MEVSCVISSIICVWTIVTFMYEIIFSTENFNPRVRESYIRFLDDISDIFLFSSQYIERRFNSNSLKKMVLIQTSVSSLMYLGLCLYAPTLALEAVTSVSSGTYILILGLVVTCYSAVVSTYSKKISWDVITNLNYYSFTVYIICIKFSALRAYICKTFKSIDKYAIKHSLPALSACL